MAKITGPSNISKRMLARKLWKTKRPVWRDVSKRLMAPQKNRVEKNLSDIHRITNDGDVIVIPGKILGNGVLTKSITVASYAVSKSALLKMKASKIEHLSIEELVERHPEGKGIRIIV